jgi:molybdopterin converting factor small subunit
MADNITVLIPMPMRPQVDDNESIVASGNTVMDVLGVITGQYPKLGERLFKSDNVVNRFVNIFLNDEDVRFLDDLETEMADGDELSIVPAIAGG